MEFIQKPWKQANSEKAMCFLTMVSKSGVNIQKHECDIGPLKYISDKQRILIFAFFKKKTLPLSSTDPRPASEIMTIKSWNVKATY